MTNTERSFRYPWPVASPEQLSTEMDRSWTMHGRIGLCGWYCTWLPGPRRVVMWDEAAKLVKDYVQKTSSLGLSK